MRDVIWTIIVIWVVWRIIDSIKARTVVFQKHEHHHSSSGPREGIVSIDQSNVRKPKQTPHSGNEGEYVDYEEIK